MNQNNQSVDPDRLIKKLGSRTIETLSGKTVAIIGLGSLGSKTAVMLAENLVGGFVLIDKDILESHNVVRHAGDLRYVGQPKVEVVRDLIRYRNPDARIVTIQDYAQNAYHALEGVDLVIVAGLGSEKAQQTIGMELRELGLPTLFGGIYERGVAGEILYVSPDGGPCYSCFSSILRDVTDSSTDQKVDYGLPPDEVKAEPGLGIHVTRVAAVLADWALRLLVNNAEVLPLFEDNMVILSNEKYQIGTTQKGKPVVIPPSSSWWNTMKKKENCLVCGLSHDELHSTDSISDLLE